MQNTAIESPSLKKLRIIWALDPSEPSGQLQRNLIHALREIKSHWKASIEPVHVFSTAQDYIFQETSFGLRRAARSALEDRLRPLGKSRLPLLTPTLIESPNPSLKSRVDALCDYARGSGADLIIANTHAKTGLRGVFLGSFAESLLLRSTVPVLTVNPRFRKPRSTRRILFPTSFGRGSQRMFRQAVGAAKHFGARLTIFHAIPYPIEPYTGIHYIPKAHRDLLLDYLRRETARTGRHARAWIRWAKGQGVRADFKFDTREGSLWKLIADQSERESASLVVMEAQRGPLSARIFGSTARQLVRHSRCPVWILSSRYARRKTEPKPAIGRVA